MLLNKSRQAVSKEQIKEKKNEEDENKTMVLLQVKYEPISTKANDSRTNPLKVTLRPP